MYARIIVGTDGSRRALDAVKAAGELAALGGCSEVHVVTSARVYSTNEMAHILEELPKEFHDVVDPRLEATDRFNEARRRLPPSVEMITYEGDGDPANLILDVAQSIDADLIVVGARGINAVERFVRGSVSTKVAHHAPCDVLIVEHDS